MISRVFDGHLDLAYLVEEGRDMHANPAGCGGRLLPAAVTLPSLREGGVRACLGTIFTEAKDTGDAEEMGACAYPAGDAGAAHRAGLRQLELYEAWAREGAIELMGGEAQGTEARRHGGTKGQTEKQRDEGERGLSASEGLVPDEHRLRLGILMECADPIRTPDELKWWVERGVVAIGLAWWHGSRYAAGNGSPPEEKAGLTALGRELVARMDELGVVHDITHLSQRAVDDLFGATDARIVASHSNCRALLADALTIESQRHIDDDAIREIARRGGMIGINLVSNFLQPGIERGDRPGIEWVVRHIEHVCEIVGDRRHVGLGTDMDGGFTAEHLPAGIDRPRDMRKIFGALRDAGWSDGDVGAFAWGNWARFWAMGNGQ